MSTRASTDLVTDECERTELTWTFDLYGQQPADLAIYTLGDLHGPTMAVEIYREDAERIIATLTADLDRIPKRSDQ